MDGYWAKSHPCLSVQCRKHDSKIHDILKAESMPQKKSFTFKTFSTFNNRPALPFLQHMQVRSAKMVGNFYQNIGIANAVFTCHP
jgi:hypothetical protein